MSKPLLKLTEKDLTARLKPALLTALKRDAGEFFKAHVSRAISTWPEDAGLAAVRLVQLCGRIPTEALVAEIRGTAAADPSTISHQPSAAPVADPITPNSSPVTLPPSP